MKINSLLFKLKKILYFLVNKFKELIHIYRALRYANSKLVLDVNDALESIYPDNRGSCLANNLVSHAHDLQVIVPVYNVEQYVEECLDSLVNQITNYSYVITIINDGATDNSRNIIEKYKENPNVIIIDQENKGHSGARNTALSNILGHYITFVDSDDVLPQGAIEALLSRAYELKADILEGAYAKLYKGNITLCPQSEELNRKWLRGVPWGKVFKSELFIDIKFPEKYWFEDTIMAFILFYKAKSMVRISTPVYYYRYNPYSVSSTFAGNPKALDTLYITRAILRDLESIGISYDPSMYDTFLGQLKINFIRTITIPDVRTIYAVFLETCNLRNKYFHELRTNDSKLLPIENALINADFKSYIQCLW